MQQLTGVLGDMVVWFTSNKAYVRGAYGIASTPEGETIVVEQNTDIPKYDKYEALCLEGAITHFTEGKPKEVRAMCYRYIERAIREYFGNAPIAHSIIRFSDAYGPTAVYKVCVIAHNKAYFDEAHVSWGY